MKKFTSFIAPLILTFFFLFQSFDGKAQVTYTTSQSGPWNNAATWGGAGFPTAADDAIIIGNVAITVSGQFQCRNLLLDVNSANTITIGPFPFFSLTINGTMAGWDNTFGFPSVPSINVSSINPSGAGGSLIFTGSNIAGLGGVGIFTEVIAYWNNVNQINVNVSFTTSSTKFIDWLYDPFFAPTFIDFLKNVTVSGGTVQSGTNAFTGFRLSGGAAVLSVSSGASLTLNAPVTSDGTNSINQFSLSGTATTSSYINSTTFTITSTGILNTSYAGTQGWWSGSTIPTTFTINAVSTINYSASSAQNVYSRQYGNLELSNTGAKTLNGSDPMDIHGNMNISSGTVTFDSQSNAVTINGNLNNSGSWTPTQSIAFEGTGTQTITGSGTTFSGGMVVGTGLTSTVLELSGPLATTDITINASATFDPKNNNLTLSGNWKNDGTYTTGTESITFSGTTDISGATTTTFNDIIISGILNCNATTINVSGSFTNNNTFNRGTGEMVFNGSGTQTIGGSASTSFHNLTISNTTPGSDVVNINSNVSLYNVLTLNANGHIDADGTGSGSTTLISESGGTAKIGTIGSGGVFDGNITTQRFVAEGTTGWRYISTSVKNQTLADWNDDFSIQGVVGGSHPAGASVIFTYDETAGTNGNNGVDGWSPFVNMTDNITNEGIRVYLYEDQLVGDLTLDNTGPPVVGDGVNNTVLGTEQYTINLDFTSSGFDGGGWNLVENPYPCEIDYESVITSLGLVNVDNGIYIWNPTVGQSGNYGSYIGGVSTNSVTQYIASGQSFMVKANNTGGSISYIEADKVTNEGNTFIREGEVENVLKIQVASSDQINFDEAAVRFKQGSSEIFESDVDAYKLANGWINISTLPQEDLDLSINTLDDFKITTSVKMRLAAYKDGEFNLSFSGFDSFMDIVQLHLVDNYLDKTTLVDAETEYVFQVALNNPETFGDERFELQLIKPVSFSFDQVATRGDQEFVMPVYTDQFTDVVNAKLVIGWDESELTFVEIEDEGELNINDFDLSMVENGSLSVNSTFASPLELANQANLFSMRFVSTNVTDSAQLFFEQAAMSITASDEGDIDVPFNTTDETIEITQTRKVSGEVTTFLGELVDRVTVQIVGGESLDSITGINGTYSLTVKKDSAYTLSATRSDDLKLNEAVTTVDIVRTRRHILQNQEFENPYQIVAADVNNSESVTALDMAQMRKVVLGIDEGFVSGLNWLFIPDAFDLSMDPFNFETSLNISLFDQNQNLDFVAVKIGDVNNSWANHAGARSAMGEIELNLKIVEAKGNIIEIPVTVSDFKQISGYQFTLTWDANHLEYQGIEHMALEGQFNELFIEDGILTTLWDERQGKSVDLENGAVLFKMKFRTKDDNAISLVELNSTLTPALAVDKQLNTLSINSVSAHVSLEELQHDRMTLFQNVPNPFAQSTEIGFKIVQAGLAKISVINLLGEIVYRHEQRYEPGVHAISWNTNQGSRSAPPGVYLYRLESNGQELIKKMLIK